MALSRDCLQQHRREQTLSQRWVAFGAIGATGLHLGLLPLVGFDAQALVSRSEDEPIQIVVTATDTEAALSEATPSAASEPLAAAPSPAREWPEPEPPETLDKPEPETELETEFEESETLEEPEPEAVVDESEPEAVVAEPEPEIAEEPDLAPDPEATLDTEALAAEAETAEAEAIEGGGKPEQVAKQPATGTPTTPTTGEVAPVVALAPSQDAIAGAEETPAATPELVGLLDGYFPEGTEDSLLDSNGLGEVVRGSGPGDRGNATEDNQGNGEGSGSRTVRCNSCARPSYPASALADGVEGEPKVSVQFDASGNVIGVTLERSSGNPDLDQAALASAEQWQFDTGGQGGSVSVEIPFVLEGSDRHRQAQQRGDRESVAVLDQSTVVNRGAEGNDPPTGPNPVNNPPEPAEGTHPQETGGEGAAAANSSDPAEAIPTEESSGVAATGESHETTSGNEDTTAPTTDAAPESSEPAAVEPAAQPSSGPTALPELAPAISPPAAPAEVAPPVEPATEE